MNLGANFLNNLFNDLLRLSSMSTIVVMCIFLIRLILKNKINAKFQYALWFVLIFRLVLPSTPVSKISIYNYVPPIGSLSYTGELSNSTTIFNSSYAPIAKNFVLKNNIDYTSFENIKTTFLSFAKTYLPKLWILGISIIMIVLVLCYLKFVSNFKNAKAITDNHILEIFNHCKEVMSINSDITLLQTNIIKTPALFGLIKPKIIIPTKLLEEANYNYIRYALLHELAHIKRKDILVNYIVTLLSIVYWFNPLVWYGFHLMREDRELCCDSLALSYINEDEVYEYGFAIIKLAEISSRAPWLPGMAGIINKNSKIKRRIIMIKCFKKNSYKLSAVALAVLLIVSCISLTDVKAESNTTPKETKQEGHPGQIIFDNLDYPFINDEAVIGKWESVDFVYEIENFTPGKRFSEIDLYLKSMTILPEGKMAQPVATGLQSDEKTPVKWLTWTKGIIMHQGDQTASKYVIKEINGEEYLFFEWKSGDYTIRGQKPYYYVLKKVS
jgi:bla regulator protein BlaR1